MTNAFKESTAWIWTEQAAQPDEFAEFHDSFNCSDSQALRLRLCADSDYAVYINGALAGFGQYPGYPELRTYDDLDITALAHSGENSMMIRVWHYGAGSQTHAPGKAGLIYELYHETELLAFSSPNTLSCLSALYTSHSCEFITTQLGFNYHVDNTRPANILTPSQAEKPSCAFVSRPIEKLVLRDRINAAMIQKGAFFLHGGDNAAQLMQNAALTCDMMPSPHSWNEEPIALDACGDGVYFFVDLHEETAGFLDFDLKTDEECEMLVGYGEHLDDGRCRTAVRNFSFTFRLKKGRTQFLDTFRRLGCRYLQFFVRTPHITVYYAGLRPTEYPVAMKEYRSGNLLRDTIYRVSQNTLLQCMHDHYEDCPWREQALYTMDSRNQMLCGYYAFSETRFARASLELISRSLRPDGFLSICAPDHMKICIPFFNLMYFVQMREYVSYSGDTAFAETLFPMLSALMKKFIDQIAPNGLLLNCTGKGMGYWNFYEWSDTLSGNGFDETEPFFDAPLNAVFVLALREFASLCNLIGRSGEAYIKLAEHLKIAIAQQFFRPEDGLFATSIGRFEGRYSVLTNSLCLLCGAADGLPQERILETLLTNGDGKEIPCTLSMNCFRYDALLAANRKAYAPAILSEIDETYLYMLRRNATSFWETLKGAEDFWGAGSLCHGWSALPIYYYETLCQETSK